MARGEILSLVFSDGVETDPAATAPISAAVIVDATGWNNVATTITYDLTTYGVTDGRDYFWSIQGLPANFNRQEFAQFDFPTATSLRVTVSDPLPAGTYTILGK